MSAPLIEVSAPEVEALNANVVADTDEPHFVLKRDALESACARPAMLAAYGDAPDVLDMALALLFGISQNHPFSQGNKRTGLLAAVILLERNGYAFEAPDEGELAVQIIAVIEGLLSLDDFRTLVEPYVIPI